jgi:hypothetical protein
MASRSQPCGDAKSAATEAEPSAAAEAAIVAFLDRAQARDLEKDAGHGYRLARDIAHAVGLEKTACRVLLERMATEGLIRREQYTNALMWRSIKPLPWEVGGTLTIQRALEAEMWAGELNLVVQACWMERGHLTSRDVKAYPAGLRERAEAYVQSENWQSEARRRDDRAYNSHLNEGYTAPPTYRLVTLMPAAPAKAEAS